MKDKFKDIRPEFFKLLEEAETDLFTVLTGVIKCAYRNSNIAYDNSTSKEEKNALVYDIDMLDRTYFFLCGYGLEEEFEAQEKTC